MWAAQVTGSGDDASSPEEERLSDFEERVQQAEQAAPAVLEYRHAPRAGYSVHAEALLAAHYALDATPPWPFGQPIGPKGKLNLPWAKDWRTLSCADGRERLIDWAALATALETLLHVAQAARLDDQLLQPSFDRLCSRLAHLAASPAPRSTQYKRSRTRTAAKAIDKCTRIWAPFLRLAEKHDASTSSAGSGSAAASSSRTSSPEASGSEETSQKSAEPDTQRSLLASSVERSWLQRPPHGDLQPRADVIDIDADLLPAEALEQLQQLLSLHSRYSSRASSTTPVPFFDEENGQTHLYILGSAEQRAAVINYVAPNKPYRLMDATLILTQRCTSLRSDGVLPPPLPPSVACFDAVVNGRFRDSPTSPFRGLARAIAAGSASYIDVDSFGSRGSLSKLPWAMTKRFPLERAAGLGLPLPSLASLATSVAKQAGVSSAELSGIIPDSLLRHFDFPPYPCVSCIRFVHAPPGGKPLWSKLQEKLPDDKSISFFSACQKLKDLDAIVADVRTHGYMPPWTDYLFPSSRYTNGPCAERSPRSIAIGGTGPWIAGLPHCESEWRFCYDCAVLHISRQMPGGARCGCLMCRQPAQSLLLPPQEQQQQSRFLFSSTWRRHLLDQPKTESK